MVTDKPNEAEEENVMLNVGIGAGYGEPTSSKRPFVTVVIALLNEKGYIEKCLDSLLNQTYPDDCYEILCYDGGSTDGSKEYLLQIAQQFPRVQLIDNPRKVAAAGWNLGFKKARGEYVVMMGGHAYVEADFLEKNVSILEAEDTPCAGGIVQAIGEDFKSKAIASAFNHPFGVGNARYRYAREKCRVETINFGTYRKSVVDAVPPINEEIKRGEDWEYNYQIVRKFGKMVFSPDIRVYYFSRATFKNLWRRQFDAGFYKLDIIRKYPSSLLLRHLVPFLFAAAALLGPLLILLGLPPLLLAGFWGIYLAGNLGAALRVAWRQDIRYFPYLVWAFFVMHFAYGLGFFLGTLTLFKVKKLK